MNNCLSEKNLGLVNVKEHQAEVNAMKSSMDTNTEDKIFTESYVENSEDGGGFGAKAGADLNEFDPISAVPFDNYRAQKMLPRNHNLVKKIESNSRGQFDDTSESSVDEFTLESSQHAHKSVKNKLYFNDHTGKSITPMQATKSTMN